MLIEKDVMVMMQIVPKWRVTVERQGESSATQSIVFFFVSTHSLVNVLTCISQLDFANGAIEPSKLTIEQIAIMPTTVSVSSSQGSTCPGIPQPQWKAPIPLY